MFVLKNDWKEKWERGVHYKAMAPPYWDGCCSVALNVNRMSYPSSRHAGTKLSGVEWMVLFPCFESRMDERCLLRVFAPFWGEGFAQTFGDTSRDSAQPRNDPACIGQIHR